MSLHLVAGGRGYAERRASAVARVGEALRSLDQQGWVVLTGRRMPGLAEHLLHVVVGPAGVVLVAPFVGEAPGYQTWRVRHRLEAARFEAVLAAELGRRVVPVTVVAVGVAGWPRHGRSTLDGVVVCAGDGDRLVTCIRQLPPVLAAPRVAGIGTVVDRLCPPARPSSHGELMAIRQDRPSGTVPG